MARIIYYIIEKKIQYGGELVEISERLPSIAFRCTGICIPNHFKMITTPEGSPKVECGISFNSKSEPVNVQGNHQNKISRSPDFLNLDILLSSNYISGFLKDKDTKEQFISEYSVFIYLRLEVR